MAKRPTAAKTTPAPQDAPARRAWPADAVERWALDKIKPYPRNARLHSDKQVAQIAASMRKFGVTTPVLVDEDGVLIFGHGRRRAAELLGYDELPVSVAKGWTEDEKNGYRVADNQLALEAEWDLPVLAGVLRELKENDFDLPVLGFPDLKLVEFMAGVGQPAGNEPAPAAPTDREMTPAEKRLMISAWQKLAVEWIGILERERQQPLSSNFTPAALAVHFLRARFFGASIPSAATLAYTPHRVLINGDGTKENGKSAETRGGSIVDGLKLATTNAGNAVERLWFVLGAQPRFDKLISGTLPFLACRLPGDFPADLARALYDEFAPGPGARVLDPCHGWGGRMLGFLLSNGGGLYHGFEVDPRTSVGVKLMFADLKPLAASDRSANLELKPFEDSTLADNTYDFALTSPPYFNVEKYGGDLSSWKRHGTFEKWVAGFYRPLIVKTAKALKPGAVFALQIGNQTYPLEQTALTVAAECALEHVATRATGMVNNFAETSAEDGEVIVILRKRPI